MGWLYQNFFQKVNLNHSKGINTTSQMKELQLSCLKVHVLHLVPLCQVFGMSFVLTCTVSVKVALSSLCTQIWEKMIWWFVDGVDLHTAECGSGYNNVQTITTKFEADFFFTLPYTFSTLEAQNLNIFCAEINKFVSHTILSNSNC